MLDDDERDVEVELDSLDPSSLQGDVDERTMRVPPPPAAPDAGAPVHAYVAPPPKTYGLAVTLGAIGCGLLLVLAITAILLLGR